MPGLNAVCDTGAAAFTGSQPVPVSTAFRILGATRVPPLATVAIMTAMASGVTQSCPWPIATEMVSPGYHRSPVVASFQADDGTRLSLSCGRSMPVFPVRPRRSAHLWIWSIESMFPSV